MSVIYFLNCFFRCRLVACRLPFVGMPRFAKSFPCALHDLWRRGLRNAKNGIQRHGAFNFRFCERLLFLVSWLRHALLSRRSLWLWLRHVLLFDDFAKRASGSADHAVQNVVEGWVTRHVFL